MVSHTQKNSYFKGQRLQNKLAHITFWSDVNFFLMKLIVFVACTHPLNPFSRGPSSLIISVHHVAMLSHMTKLSNYSFYMFLLYMCKVSGMVNMCWATRLCADNGQHFGTLSHGV